MKKRKSALVYVHGTNGSGKSTLARMLVAAAGGSTKVFNAAYTKGHKAFATHTNEGVVFMGKYANACGGVDGFSPYAAIHELMQWHAEDTMPHMFAEGLITPGVETCQRLADGFDQHLYIALTVPEERCIQHVLRRRATKGNDAEFNPANLRKKLESVRGWADRLEKAGLSVKRLSWREAYLASTSLLGLDNINHHL